MAINFKSDVNFRWQFSITGFVQGVGFRPFVSLLAQELGITGFIQNSSSGVIIEAEGSLSQLKQFHLKLQSKKPPQARIYSLKKQSLTLQHSRTFQIKTSQTQSDGSRWILPDMALCQDCLADISNRSNRRFDYPFTSCTNCGPRFSIITDLPYDRPSTSMFSFPLCPSCGQEYQDKQDRRYHAQPIACSTCGPSLQLYNRQRIPVLTQDILLKVNDLLESGAIIGTKGLGGFQLLLDATNEATVALLRFRKHRPDKPFALLFKDLASIRQYATISDTESKLLMSPAAPIVIVKKKSRSKLAPSIAPDNPNIGVMIASNPLLALIANAFNAPLVCTSGNISGEPIVTQNDEAIVKLADLVDYFLLHDRDIVHHVDDSVIKLAGKQPIIIRRARGYVPAPIFAPFELPPLVALGGQQKSTIAVSQTNQVIVSQHIGDLDSPASIDRLERVVADYTHLYHSRPSHLVCDAHPEYETTTLSHTFNLPIIPIYHHQAHIAACMLEHQLTKEVLGVSWDGAGYGPDHTMWGGEFLVTDLLSNNRVASLKPFLLAGGDKAAREPKRIALALLFETYGLGAFAHPWTMTHFSSKDINLYRQIFQSKKQTIVTTSMGRLFDGFASLLDVRHKISFEGQAAMELEFLSDITGALPYPFSINRQSLLEIDWSPMVEAVLSDIDQGINKHLISSRYHRTLVEIIVSVANIIRLPRVVLSGGCFQNAQLVKNSVSALRANGFTVYTHHQLPANDGGLSAGQIYSAAKFLRQK